MEDLILTAYPQYCIVTCDGDCMANLYHYGFILSTIFTVLTCLIALYNIVMHFINFNNPYFQSKIIILLLMGPAYCFTALFPFLSLKSTPYLQVAREIFQGFVLMEFFYLIFSYLAYDHQKNELVQRKVYEIMRNECSQIPHQYPFSYFQKPYQLSNWIKAKFFSHRCKRAILQFIVMKIVTSAFLILVYPNYQLRTRDLKDWDYIVYQKVNTYIYWILTISSYVAYYYMSLLYTCIQKPLQPFKPDMKFATFNTAIFFVYWQKIWMVIFQNDILGCFDHNATQYHYKKIMYGIEHVLICFEMFIMMIAAAEAYSYQNYRLRTVRNIGSIWYILSDTFKIFLMELRLFNPKRIGFKAKSDSRETELMTITHSARRSIQNLGCQVNIQKPIPDALKLNYF